MILIIYKVNNMNNKNIVYYVDREAKYYFDMQFIEVVHNNDFNVDLYKCKILYNKYKFNNSSFQPNLELKDKIDIFTKYSIVKSLSEAEDLIKK